MKKFFPPLEYVNIPNIATTTGLVSGIVACFFMLQGNMISTIFCLLLATFMDVIDGFLAKKLKQQTRFGEYMDLLTDFFVCCVVPVLLIYTFVEVSLLTVAAASFYAVCGLWRLAYFINVTTTEKQPYFTGMPVPGAMLFGIVSIWLYWRLNAAEIAVPAFAPALCFFALGGLMISSVKFKKYGFCQKGLIIFGLAFLAAIFIF
ncbi:MAG: CDP-alcohol phosphatidyltransferase family protein [Oscillospiraceae bacterium]|nr:CDP-alcohol phosphatidyltransferase family protein [Oscillospiraceae bacterium]